MVFFSALNPFQFWDQLTILLMSRCSSFCWCTRWAKITWNYFSQQFLKPVLFSHYYWHICAFEVIACSYLFSNFTQLLNLTSCNIHSEMLRLKYFYYQVSFKVLLCVGGWPLKAVETRGITWNEKNESWSSYTIITI